MAKLEERLAIWNAPGFWNSSETNGYELFEAADSGELGVGKGSALTACSLIVFKDSLVPTGLVIEFDDKTRLWSAPVARGNFVSLDPTDFIWPTETELLPLF